MSITRGIRIVRSSYGLIQIVVFFCRCIVCRLMNMQNRVTNVDNILGKIFIGLLFLRQANHYRFRINMACITRIYQQVVAFINYSFSRKIRSVFCTENSIALTYHRRSVRKIRSRRSIGKLTRCIILGISIFSQPEQADQVTLLERKFVVYPCGTRTGLRAIFCNGESHPADSLAFRSIRDPSLSRSSWLQLANAAGRTNVHNNFLFMSFSY